MRMAGCRDGGGFGVDWGTVKTRVQGQGSRSKSLRAGRSPECIVFLWEGQGQGPYPLLRHCGHC